MMRHRASRFWVVLLVPSLLCFDAPNANTQVGAVIAAVAEIISAANNLNNLLNGKKDLDSVRSDLSQIKATLNQMDQKLDNISKAIDALPGFITDQLDEEARRRLFTVLRTDAVEFDEWASDPKSHVHEINDAITHLHETSDNLIFRKDRTPLTIYGNYNVVALAMTVEYKLLLLTERKTPSTTHFQIYADFFREATNDKTIGSLAQYRIQLESDISKMEKLNGQFAQPICCISGPNSMQVNVAGQQCGYDLGQKVLGDLKAGYTDNGGQVYCQVLSAPAACVNAKVMYISIPAYNTSSRGCASNLNAEREVYFAKEKAEEVTTAALKSAVTFRKAAYKLAGR